MDHGNTKKVRHGPHQKIKGPANQCNVVARTLMAGKNRRGACGEPGENGRTHKFLGQGLDEIREPSNEIGLISPERTEGQRGNMPCEKPQNPPQIRKANKTEFH
jgi:hypothetical protein